MPLCPRRSSVGNWAASAERDRGSSLGAMVSAVGSEAVRASNAARNAGSIGGCSPVVLNSSPLSQESAIRSSPERCGKGWVVRLMPLKSSVRVDAKVNRAADASPGCRSLGSRPTRRQETGTSRHADSADHHLGDGGRIGRPPRSLQPLRGEQDPHSPRWHGRMDPSILHR